MSSQLQDIPDVLLPPIVLLRAFYLAASLLILVLQAVPALRARFLPYGSRATTLKHGQKQPTEQQSTITRLLDAAAAVQVPHSYFVHFYITSLACSLFWAWQLRVWDAHAQLQIVWALMLLQGLRRMIESHTYMSTSKSTMWLAHWLLGLVFYMTVHIAIWIEGPHHAPVILTSSLLVPAILTAHALQHTFHAYLYHLRTENKDYQLPAHPLFPNLLCPHYTCEIAIYTLLSFLAAPKDRIVNWTLVCGTLFVATNLGVTAFGTKQWYVEKFGADKVGSLKRMIPGIW